MFYENATGLLQRCFSEPSAVEFAAVDSEDPFFGPNVDFDIFDWHGALG